jgi:hypothetical protein
MAPPRKDALAPGPCLLGPFGGPRLAQKSTKICHFWDHFLDMFCSILKLVLGFKMFTKLVQTLFFLDQFFGSSVVCFESS